MQLASDLWLEGPFYVDFDRHGQFRIIGPQNHLFFGSVSLYKDSLKVESLALRNHQLTVTGTIAAKSIFFHDPAIGHVRKMRRFTEGQSSMPFEQVARKFPGELVPNYIGTLDTKEGYEISYRRLYRDHWYGATVFFPDAVRVERVEKRRGFKLTSTRTSIPFVITTDTDILPKPGIDHIFMNEKIKMNDPGLQKLWQRAGTETTHLVQNNKTSGVEYGTIFPRDWMESADLGEGDLTPQATAYMYHKALELTDEHGQGWHENSVGEMEAEQTEELDVLDQNLDELIDASSRLSHSIKSMIEQLRRLYINRNMIDIEPHYLLGLRLIKPEDISEPDADRMRRVARYVLDHAERNDLITFKRVPTFFKRHRDDDYTHEGNWRDSREAYKMIHPVIAPYDVNVVFYPQALRTMLQHAKWLNIDPSHIEPLIAKWDRVREWFRFTNADGSAGYALALYDVQTLEPGVKYRRMEVNHLDESYDLFYGQPAEVDVINFAERLISPDYFYTPSGPLLVGANDGFETTDYHGKVIWTKQTAFTVAGLERQLKLHGASWKPATRELANKALTATVEASVAAFKSLGAAPELHYDYKGQPRFYTDQKHAKGPMNLIQLWSAVGARRIMNAYNEASNGR